jgi:hypothetical protein
MKIPMPTEEERAAFLSRNATAETPMLTSMRRTYHDLRTGGDKELKESVTSFEILVVSQ